MRKILKRIISGVASLALGVSALASSFTMSASAVGQLNRMYTMIQDNDPITSGTNAIWYLRLGHHIGNYQYDEQFDVFCIENGVQATRGEGYYKVGSNGYSTPKLNIDQRKLVSEICYYGYANHKNMNYYAATQALIWEVAAGRRNTATFALTGTSLRSAAAAYSSAAGTAYDTIAASVLKFRSTPTSNAGTHTLTWNASANRYQVSIPISSVGTGATDESNDFASKVSSAQLSVTTSGSNYIVYTSTYFSGTKTVNYNRKLAQPFTYDEFQKNYSQAVCAAGGADPRDSIIRFNAQEVRGDFTVVKKSVKSNGTEDAVLVESVRKDARFMVYDVAAERYIKTSIDAQGNYQYVSSDGFSNTSTNPGTIFKLNTEGKFTVTNLPLGKTFRVIEYETAAHYEIPKATIEVTLDESNKSQTKEQPNKHTNSLYVSKKAIAESDDKNHINGAELKDAKMSIVAEDGTTFATWTSDGTEHLVEDIPAGKYTLKELAAPDGYQIATDISFEVDENNKVTATGATVESKDDIPLIVMFDEVTRTDISKVDATTGKELAGAELKLYDWNDVLVDSWTSSNEPHKVYGLVVGKTYRLSESLAPIGYAKTTDVNFTVLGVDAQGKAQVTKVEMKDEIARGTIKVHKRTEGNLNVENIKFIVEGTTNAGDKFTTDGLTDKNGEVEFLIPTGVYTVTEDKETTPTAYIVAEAQDNVSVEYAQTTELTFFNSEKTGSIKIQKRTEGNINLEGIEFTLSGKSTSGRDINITSKTDANGVAEFKNIPIGDYTVKESGGVNAAYIIAEPQKVTVLYAQQTDATFFNELKTGSIKVQKKTKDMTNIEGITFNLSGKSDAGTDVNISGKTDANGVCEFKNIPIGTYKITESGVPAGYLVASPQDVTVLYAQTIEATFVNEEKPEKPSTPPQTGFNGGNSTTIMLLLISVGAISCGAFIGKRKEDK
ncbi:MAG: Cys-Gln thioester bond-forming surface protein [Ruminococcus sp.]|nr:Cys-Gln thioester bond-forming surface protein [Ruminococcus sp.]